MLLKKAVADCQAAGMAENALLMEALTEKKKIEQLLAKLGVAGQLQDIEVLLCNAKMTVQHIKFHEFKRYAHSAGPGSVTGGLGEYLGSLQDPTWGSKEPLGAPGSQQGGSEEPLGAPRTDLRSRGATWEPSGPT